MNSPKFFYIVAILAMATTYVRLFFGVDVTDEAYHVACALLTALDAQFFVNDSQIGQSASLAYEPILMIYHKFFSTFGVVLFVRHLYFLLSLIAFYSIYRLLKKGLANEVAFLISCLAVIFIPYPSPTLGYNAVGSLFFAIGVAMTLNFSLTNRLCLCLVGGWAFSVSAFAYPAFGLAAMLFYFGIIYIEWRQSKKAILKTASGAFVFLSVYFLFWGLASYRFGFESILTAAKTTQLYGSGIVTPEFLKLKLNMFAEAMSSLAPPLWALGLLAIATIAMHWRKISWTWLIPLIGVLFLITVPAPLSEKLSPLLYISPLFLTLIFLLGLPSLLIPSEDKKKADKKEFAAFARLVVLICTIIGIVCFLNSSTQVVATALGTRLGLIFLLALAATRVSRQAIMVPMISICIVVNYYNYIFSYREEPLLNMNSLITTGPFAGIVVSESKANFLNQLEEDLTRTSVGATSIVSYDNFPAGFLFTSLRPATRSIFVHPLPYGHWDRADYVKYYSESSNRPDIILQMEIFPYASNSFSINRNEWTKLPYDDFFDHLPNTGEYDEVQVRYIQSHVSYRIWRKKSLPKLQKIF